MILIIREAPFIRELLKISDDRLLPYENAEEPLLLRFNWLVLQADYVAFCVGEIDIVSGSYEPCSFSCNHTLISDW
jgi:hypothetical protein